MTKRILLTIVILAIGTFATSALAGTKETSSILATTESGINLTAHAGEDQRVIINSSISLFGSASGTDGSIVSYEWKEGGNVLATTASFKYTPLVYGVYTLTLTVTDSQNNVASDDVVLTVRDGVSAAPDQGTLGVVERNENNDTLSIVGKWEGTYFCSQGETGLTLTISSTTRNEVEADFSFYAIESNPNVPPGRYTMNGNYNNQGLLYLSAEAWIDRPSNYMMVDLDGIFNEGYTTYSGTVNNSRCSSFNLIKEDNSVVGDVNGDGNINIQDVVVIINIVLGTSSSSNADVNQDGQVNIQDTIVLINIILGSSQT